MSTLTILALALMAAAFGVTIFGAMNDRPVSPIGMGLLVAGMAVGVRARRQTGK